MMLWLFACLMTLAAVAAVLWPLLRSKEVETDPNAYNRTVYKDQIAEIERDLNRGVINPQEAEAARNEIARRLLAAESQAAAHRPGTARPAVIALVVAGLLVPLLGGSVYLLVGKPDQPGAPFAQRGLSGSTDQRASAAEGAHPGMADMVANLEKRLQDNPQDAEGWALLARSYSTLNRFAEAADAYGRAVELTDGRDTQLLAEFAEASTIAKSGLVTEPALTAFRTVVARNPGDVRARYYLARFKSQRGDEESALADVALLLAEAPAGATWVPLVQDEFNRLASKLGKDPRRVMQEARDKVAAGQSPGIAVPQETRPQTPLEAVRGETPRASAPPQSDGGQPMRGPTQADIERAQSMSTEDRQAMIRGMVDGLAMRLESNPDDLQGWLRLARSYRVLGEMGKSAEAYAKAASLAPQDASVQSAYGEALVEAQGAGATVPKAARTVFAKANALDPTDGASLWYLGLYAAQNGKPGEARSYWTDLLALMPPSAPQRAQIQNAIDTLPEG